MIEFWPKHTKMAGRAPTSRTSRFCVFCQNSIMKCVAFVKFEHSLNEHKIGFYSAKFHPEWWPECHKHKNANPAPIVSSANRFRSQYWGGWILALSFRFPKQAPNTAPIFWGGVTLRRVAGAFAWPLHDTARSHGTVKQCPETNFCWTCFDF